MTLDLKVPPLLVFLLSLAAMRGVAAKLPGARFDLPLPDVVPALLGLAGIGLCLAGIISFHRHGTTVHPMHPDKASAVVDSGVFRYTRNPMYLGLAALLLAYGIHLANAAALVVVAGFVAYVARFQVMPEERALLRKFGGDYACYMRRVRRWL